MLQDLTALTRIAERLRSAMVEPSDAELGALFHDDLSYGHSDGKIDTKASITASLLDGRSDFTTIEISEQTVAQVDDVAMVRHVLTADTNDSGKPGHVRLKVLLVWVLQAGQWRLLARQAVKAPLV
jgi:hypothetical protein